MVLILEYIVIVAHFCFVLEKKWFCFWYISIMTHVVLRVSVVTTFHVSDLVTTFHVSDLSHDHHHMSHDHRHMSHDRRHMTQDTVWWVQGSAQSLCGYTISHFLRLFCIANVFLPVTDSWRQGRCSFILTNI